MAKPKTDEKDADRDEAEESADRDEAAPEEGEAGADERSSEGAEGEGGEEAARDADADADEERPAPKGEAQAEEDADEEEVAAAQLGTQRYVLAAFFAAGILGAYIVGKAIHGIWAWAANKEWFHGTLPSLAAVADEDKTTWGTVIGAIIAVVMVVRTYRKAEVRAWADEVATELTKVKWPTRKEVTSSTVVVIAAGAVATIYLAALDRFWSFVTDLFYGTGS